MIFNEKETISLSSLGRTWIFDLDGTLVKHNGYKIDGKDSLLPGVQEFFEKLRDEDIVVIITARPIEWKSYTEVFLEKSKIKFDHIIYDAPHGERILINDKKNSGLNTAYAFNTKRDEFLRTDFVTNHQL